MAKFRKRPVVVDAVQWHGANLAEINDFLNHNQHQIVTDANARPVAIVIPTLEGMMRCDLNDWIIKGVAGEYYPCKPEIFTKTYEAA